MATGTALLDFGTFPGSGHATVAVTGQATIVSGSIVEAWLRPADTANHKHDEHIVVPMRITAGNIVAGTGFTIHGYMLDRPYTHENDKNRGCAPGKGEARRTSGIWNVAWAWV